MPVFKLSNRCSPHRFYAFTAWCDYAFPDDQPIYLANWLFWSSFFLLFQSISSITKFQQHHVSLCFYWCYLLFTAIVTPFGYQFFLILPYEWFSNLFVVLVAHGYGPPGTFGYPGYISSSYICILPSLLLLLYHFIVHIELSLTFILYLYFILMYAYLAFWDEVQFIFFKLMDQCTM